jgi:hypothetical protein
VFNAVAEAARWGTTEELLATLVEQIDGLTRAFITANSKKRPNFGPPLRIPRPGQPDKPAKKGQSMTVSDLARLMKG